MADDLDDFLKQAALRRQQRQQQRAGKPTAQQQPAKPVSPVVRAEPPRLRPEPMRLEPEIPNAQVVEVSSPYVPTVGNLSTSLPSASLPSANRVPVAEPNPYATPQERPKSKSKQSKDKTPTLKETPAVSAEPQQTSKVSSASLIAQLRDPQTLRMAIIAHEIMKRPWQ